MRQQAQPRAPFETVFAPSVWGIQCNKFAFLLLLLPSYVVVYQEPSPLPIGIFVVDSVGEEDDIGDGPWLGSPLSVHRKGASEWGPLLVGFII